MDSLLEEGIQYLEYRSIDINPFSKGGISLEDLEFLELFNLYLLFKEESDYNSIDLVDDLVIDNVKRSLETGTVKVKNVTKGIEFEVTVNLTEKEIDVINVGGRLNYVKHSN